MRDEKSIARREFLAKATIGTGLGTLGCAVGPGSAIAGMLESRMRVPLHEMTPAHFTDLVGTPFRIQGENVNLRAELESVIALDSDLQRPASLPRREAFVLTFCAPGAGEMDQVTYWVQHERLGTFPMFLGPASVDRLAAVFN